jgi:hypothetical protein
MSEVPPALRPVIWLLRHFNSNPRFQYQFNLVGTAVGVAVMIAMPLVYFLAPHVWASSSILALIEITLYGNASSDYVGVSDAEASGHSAALRAIRSSAAHHRLAGRVFDALTSDARTQYRLHLVLTYVWIVQMVMAPFIFALASSFFGEYDILYTLLVNGYTNVATNFSALPGTLAAVRLQEVREGRSPWESRR